MIVIEKKYLIDFDIEKVKIKKELKENFIDIIPMEIKNNLLILPDSVLIDKIFKQIFVNFKNYIIRPVSKDEFITINIL